MNQSTDFDATLRASAGSPTSAASAAENPYDRRMSDDDDTLWYFAFGANMARAVFLRRRRMRPLSTEPARLFDHRLHFGEPGVRFIEPAFATVEPAQGTTVHGALYRLTRDDLDRLTRDESEGYDRLELPVHGESAGPVRAIVYVSRRPVQGRLPSRRYLRLLRDGARELGLPDCYQRELERHPSYSVPLLTPTVSALVLVYDHLRRAGLRHERIGAALRRLWLFRRPR